MPGLSFAKKGITAKIPNKIGGANTMAPRPHKFSKATTHRSHHGGFVTSTLEYGAGYSGAGKTIDKTKIIKNVTPVSKSSLCIIGCFQKSLGGMALPRIVPSVIFLKGESIPRNEGANKPCKEIKAKIPRGKSIACTIRKRKRAEDSEKKFANAVTI